MSALEPSPEHLTAAQHLKQSSSLPCATSTATATATVASPHVLLPEVHVIMPTCETAQGDARGALSTGSVACAREAAALEASIRATEKYRLEQHNLHLRKRVQLESALEIQLAQAKLTMAEMRTTLIQAQNERDALRNQLQQMKLAISKPNTRPEETAHEVSILQNKLLTANDLHRTAVQELAKVKNARDFATKECASWKKNFDRAQHDLALLKSRCEQLENKNRNLHHAAAEVPEKPAVEQHVYRAHVDSHAGHAVKSDAPAQQNNTSAATAADVEMHKQSIPGLGCLISPAPLQRKPSGISAPSDVVSESRSRYTATLPFPDLIGTSAKETESDKAGLPTGRRPSAQTKTQENRADRKRKASGAPAADTRSGEKSAPKVPKRPRQAPLTSEKTATEPENQESGKLEKREAGGRMLRARPRISYDYDKKGRDVMITNKSYEIDFNALRPAVLKPPKSRKSMPALPTSRPAPKKAAGLADRSKRKKSSGPSVKSQKRRS